MTEPMLHPQGLVHPELEPQKYRNDHSNHIDPKERLYFQTKDMHQNIHIDVPDLFQAEPNKSSNFIDHYDSHDLANSSKVRFWIISLIPSLKTYIIKEDRNLNRLCKNPLPDTCQLILSIEMVNRLAFYSIF
jgi:hypothetical protein